MSRGKRPLEANWKARIGRAISILLLRRQIKAIRFLASFAILLVLVGVFAIQCLQFLMPTSAAEARTTIIATAEILTTILAISVSLILVSLQYVSEAYSTRALNVFFNDAVVKGYLVTYVSSIFLVWGILTFAIVPLQFIPILTYFVLIFCVTYLVVLIFHLPRTVHPVGVINQLRKNIPKDFCQSLVKPGRIGQFVLGAADEPFFALEQILLKTIVDNDFPSFLAGNQHLESILTDFLVTTRKEIEKDKEKKEIREKPAGVFRYFLRIYRNLVLESLSHSRELHLTYLCESLKRFMIILHEIKSFWAFENVSELYEHSGLNGVEKRLLAFLDQYVHQGLRELTQTQMKILDEPVFPFEGIETRYSGLTKEEQDVWSLNDLLYGDFRKRLDFISEVAQKAAELKLEMIVSAGMAILGEVLNKALKLEPIGRKRGVIRTLVIPVIATTHTKCVNNGSNETTFTTASLHSVIDEMRKEDVPEFGRLVALAYAEMALYSIEKGFSEEVLGWGVNGRYLVKEYPDLAEIAIDVIVGALKSLKDRADAHSREWYRLARADLVGLKTWENHGHQEIINRIEHELPDCPPMDT